MRLIYCCYCLTDLSKLLCGTYNIDICMMTLVTVFCPGKIKMMYQQHDVLKEIVKKASLTHWGRDNGHHFPDVFKCIFVSENAWIIITISLKFIPKGPIWNIPALAQIMTRRWPGDKPLSEAMMVRFPTQICSLGLNELIDVYDVK